MLRGATWRSVIAGLGSITAGLGSITASLGSTAAGLGRGIAGSIADLGSIARLRFLCCRSRHAPLSVGPDLWP